MADNNVKITLTANDETRAAFDSVKSGVNSVTSSITSMQTLVASLASGAMVAYVKSVINAGDELFILSQKTGIAVENLAGLELAAKMNGASLDSVAMGVKKLSTYMFDAAAGSQEHITLLKILGVTAKEPLPAMEQIADQFAKMKDGSEKSALAVRLFGKSGADMIPMLNSGSAALRDMIAEGHKLNPVSAEFAKASNDFNDNLDRLQTAAKGAAMQLINPMLPALLNITNAMIEAKKESGSLAAIWVGMGGAAAHILGVDEASQTKKRIDELTQSIATAQKQIEAGSLKPEGTGHSFFSFLIPDIKLSSQALDSLRTNLASMKAELAGLQVKPPEAAAKPAQDDSVAAKIKAADAATKAAADAQAALKKLLDESKRMDAEMVVSHDDAFTKTMVKWTEMEQKLTAAGAAGAKARMVHEAAGTKFVLDEMDKRAEAAKVVAAAEAKHLAEQLVQENAYFAKIRAMAQDATASAIGREKLRYERELIDLKKRRDTAALDHQLSLEELAAFHQAELDLETDHEARRRALKDDSDRQIVAGEVQWQRISLDSMSAFFGMAKGLMNSHSRAAFELGKAAAISETVINTYKSATAAYSAMASIPFVGPALGAIAAAAAIASGMAQVSAIQSTSFGAANAGGGSYGGASSSLNGGQATPNYPSVPAAPARSQLAAPVAAPAPSQVNITIVGNANTLFTYDQVVNQLIPAINQAAGNGVNIKVTLA